MSETGAITVRQLNFYAKSLLEGDRNLKNITVEKKISGAPEKSPIIVRAPGFLTFISPIATKIE